MPRLKQYEPLVIHDFEEQQFHLQAHAHTYFELIYMYKGSGIHCLNNCRLSYKAGDLFLICPEDEHYFEIRKSTRFVFIKWTDSYFMNAGNLYPNTASVNDPARLTRNRLLKEKKLMFDPSTAQILKNIIENIITYQYRKDISTSPLVFYQIASILAMIRELLINMEAPIALENPDQEQLVTYLHQHIYDPRSIQIQSIASHFNIAPNYFSAYFRRCFGTSYREYVDNYKTGLIEKRIEQGHLSIKQIAAEFGFTDESHFSNFFKKKFHMSPRLYRQNKNRD